MGMRVLGLSQARNEPQGIENRRKDHPDARLGLKKIFFFFLLLLYFPLELGQAALFLPWSTPVLFFFL